MRRSALVDPYLLIAAPAMGALGAVAATDVLPVWADNAARAVVLIECAMVVAMSGSITRTYWRNYQAAPDKVRLLPRHVVQLSLMMLLLTLAVSVRTVNYVDENAPWYWLPLVLPALTLGVLGLYDMIRWLPSRRGILPTGQRRSTDA